MTGINFKKTGEEGGGDFEALPEGRYLIKVSETELTTASTGTEMIKVTFDVMDPQFKNRKLWHNFTLTEKSYIFLYNFLKAAGRGNILEEEDVEPAVVAKAMRGVLVTAWTEPGKTSAGNPKNDLSKFQAAPDGAAPAASDADAPGTKQDLFS